jgi:hypothetical protein
MKSILSNRSVGSRVRGISADRTEIDRPGNDPVENGALGTG